MATIEDRFAIRDLRMLRQTAVGGYKNATGTLFTQPCKKC